MFRLGHNNMLKQGYTQTKEQRLKISEANKGKLMSLVARKNMSDAKKRDGTRPPSNIGKKFSDKHKQKISDALKGNKNSLGKKQSKKSNKKRSIALRGEKGSNWQGGKTKLQTIIRGSFKYRQWRSDVFTKDDFTCQYCGRRGCYLEAHHLDEFSNIIDRYKIKSFEEAQNCEELWNINNGQTLCRKCHDKTKRKKGVAIWKK